MKHLRLLFLLLLNMVAGVALAYDAEIDGIYYSFSGNNAIVTYHNRYGYPSNYSGDVVIPEFVTYSSKTYRVTTIGDYAFKACNGLTSVVIPNSCTSISWAAFEDCNGLKSVTIPNSIQSIGGFAFQNCNSLTLLAIPNSVTIIEHHAFANSGLTSIVIPNSVTDLGEAAFEGCNSLTSISISNSITSINNYVFNNCSSLTSVSIPNNITSIGNEAFGKCDNLTSVTVERETPASIDKTSFVNRRNATLYVPYGCKATYEAADYWNEFKEIIEMPNPNSITVGSSGYATFSSQNALDFSEVSDIKAYIASDFDPSTYTLTLTRITEAPAEEGLYIVGTPGTYLINETTTDEVYSNLLKGVTYPTTIGPTEGDYTNFILANGKHGVAFYTISEAGELAAGKAYLQLPTASVSEVKAISVIFDDDDEDGISSSISAPSLNGEEIYNLQGQRVDKAQKGIFIVNGKKTFIK